MRRRTFAALVLTTTLALAGCTGGSENPNEGDGLDAPEQQTEATQTNFNGTDLTVIVESDGTVTWSTYAKEGPARGDVLVEVSGWSATSTETVGEVVPEIPGSSQMRV